MLIGQTFYPNFTDSSSLLSLVLLPSDLIMIPIQMKLPIEIPFSINQVKEIRTLTSGSSGNGSFNQCSMAWSFSGWLKPLQIVLLTPQAELLEDGTSQQSTLFACVIQRISKSYLNALPSSGEVSSGGGLLDGSQLQGLLGSSTLEELPELSNQRYTG